MKIVVCIPPDAGSLALNDLSEEDFIVDEETYYYFRDEVFIKGILKYIQEKHPEKLKKFLIG